MVRVSLKTNEIPICSFIRKPNFVRVKFVNEIVGTRPSQTPIKCLLRSLEVLRRYFFYILGFSNRLSFEKCSRTASYLVTYPTYFSFSSCSSDQKNRNKIWFTGSVFCYCLFIFHRCYALHCRRRRTAICTAETYGRAPKNIKM